jgi:hypothetical protein
MNAHLVPSFGTSQDRRIVLPQLLASRDYSPLTSVAVAIQVVFAEQAKEVPAAEAREPDGL